MTTPTDARRSAVLQRLLRDLVAERHRPVPPRATQDPHSVHVALLAALSADDDRKDRP